MTEKETIEQLNSIIKCMNLNRTCNISLYKEDKEAVKSAVNIIQNKQKEIEKLTKQSKNLDIEAQSYLEELAGDSGMSKRTIAQLQVEIEKKDKIIDLMAEEFVSKTLMYSDNTKQEVKQYFERKVEDK